MLSADDLGGVFTLDEHGLRAGGARGGSTLPAGEGLVAEAETAAAPGARRVLGWLPLETARLMGAIGESTAATFPETLLAGARLEATPTTTAGRTILGAIRGPVVWPIRKGPGLLSMVVATVVGTVIQVLACTA